MNRIISLLILVVLITSGYFLAPYFIGQAPTQKFVKPETLAKDTSPTNPHQADQQAAFPELDRLREAVKESPEDLGLLKELAENLKGKVIATRDKNLIFELIDVLHKVLLVDDQDQFALLELANITFESKVFSKAKDYYQRYLAVSPEDDLVRIRYASSLIFLKNSNEAIIELDQVLQNDPNNFSALSYKAIAYAELGDKDQAIKVGNQALEVAPAADVQERFASYLESIKKPQKVEDTQVAEVDDNLKNYLTTNQVTASKFVSLREEKGELLIYFKDFPMAQMPEFAKEKFFSSIKLHLSEDQSNDMYIAVKKIRFIDQVSQQELESLDIK